MTNAPQNYRAVNGRIIFGESVWLAMWFRPVKTTKTDISIFTEIVRRELDVDKVVKPVKEVA